MQLRSRRVLTVLCNEDKLKQMRSLAKAGKLSHAYLFTGARGMGKKTMALEICLSLFCRSADASGIPCGCCPECRRILSGNHPDIITVTHAKPATIGVDEIREQINNTVGIRPYSRIHKVYIIDEAEKMPPQAQNALLKTLEEPPEYVSMLILCSDEKKLLDTVLSRCVRIRMDRVPSEKIRDFLISENGVDAETAAICAAFSDGNPGRALALAVSDEFKNTYGKVLQLMKNSASMDASQLLGLSSELVSEGADLQDVLDLAALWYRDVMNMKVFGENGKFSFKGEKAALKKASAEMSGETAAAVLAEIDKASQRLRANVNKELTMELLFIKIKESGI